MNLTSSGDALYRTEQMIALSVTDLPAPVAPAINRWGIFARSAMYSSPLIVLPSAIVSFDADGGLAWYSIDADRFGFEREAKVIGEPDHSAVLDAGIGFELECGNDRPGVYAVDVTGYPELFALLGEYSSSSAQFFFG